jgi:CheY-like chemotaxis protein
MTSSSPTPVILLVEDDPGDVLMITEALERTGRPRDIHMACDGQDALDFLHRNGRYAHVPRPDLILLDLNMPRLDGREALALIKADDRLRAIPVVVFTTSAAQSDILSSYQRHACAYVTKPLDLDMLETVVQQIDGFYTSVSALLPREHERQAS